MRYDSALIMLSKDNMIGDCQLLRVYPHVTFARQQWPFKQAEMLIEELLNDGFKVVSDTKNTRNQYWRTREVWLKRGEVAPLKIHDLRVPKEVEIGKRERKLMNYLDLLEDMDFVHRRITEQGLIGLDAA